MCVCVCMCVYVRVCVRRGTERERYAMVYLNYVRCVITQNTTGILKTQKYVSNVLKYVLKNFLHQSTQLAEISSKKCNYFWLRNVDFENSTLKRLGISPKILDNLKFLVPDFRKFLKLGIRCFFVIVVFKTLKTKTLGKTSTTRVICLCFWRCFCKKQYTGVRNISFRVRVCVCVCVPVPVCVFPLSLFHLILLPII